MNKKERLDGIEEAILKVKNSNDLNLKDVEYSAAKQVTRMTTDYYKEQLTLGLITPDYNLK